MKISTKGRYALRMMIEFGLNPDQCTKISQVAARQNISDKYLEQIVTLLHRAGYVRSSRGAQGGYMLTRPPERYTVGEIIELAEGPLAPVACLLPDAESCPRIEKCTTLPLWKKYDALIHDFFYGITLDDLVKGRF